MSAQKEVNKSLPVPIRIDWLYECLEQRTRHIKIEDLFLVVHNPSGEEGEILKEIPPNILYPMFRGGYLRIFFVKAPVRTRLLWTKKFNYPRISVPKTPANLRKTPSVSQLVQ